MDEQNTSKTAYVSEFRTEGYAIRFLNVFGDKITLGQILAARVLQDMAQSSAESKDAPISEGAGN